MTGFPETFGHFRLLQRIAQGGMGEVFLARIVMADGNKREVVVKRILPHLTEQTEFVESFVREGRIASLLNHPNIVQTLEVGHVNKHYFMAMEHVPGPTLVRLLALALAERRPFSIHFILHIAQGLARALQYLHQQTDLNGQPLAIVHMDMAPHNVLITADGEPKLLDFGISRDNQSRVLSEEFRGRSAYLAPEQLMHQPPDQRVDIFALGIILHEMVVGVPLFRGRTDSETIARIVQAPIPVPSAHRVDCPASLERIIMRALSRNRDHRYVSATAMLADLDACIAQVHVGDALQERRREYSQLVNAATMARLTAEPTPSASRVWPRHGLSLTLDNDGGAFSGTGG